MTNEQLKSDKPVLKIGHTSDVHWGALERWSSENNPLEFIDRHLKNLQGILDAVEVEKPDLFLIVGDWFDKPNINIETFLASVEWLKKLTQHVPTILSAGNHDEATEGFFITEYIKRLKIPNLQVVNKPELIKFSKNQVDLNILATPWIKAKETEELKKILLDAIQYDLNKDEELDIVLLHQCFAGSRTDNGYVPKSKLQVPELLNAKYYACGDIHKYQQLNLPNAYFSGSPMQTKVDDTYDNKGFIMLDVYSKYHMVPRFIKLENPVPLVQISNLSQITNEEYWYKLVCPINERPLNIPQCVKIYEPTPAVEDVSVFIKKEHLKEGVEDATTSHLDLDLKFGLADLMNESSFTPEEIAETEKEIDQFLANNA